MGFSVALDKTIVVGVANYFGSTALDDLWFPLQHIDEDIVYADSAREAFEKLFGPPLAKSQSESPIEEKMLVALRVVLPTHVVVQQQVNICSGRYRADFAITTPHGNKIIVECDGHDFHEKSKEQAARDKKRDRDMQLEGWRVLRFTGSEIFRNANGCAQEVLRFISAPVSSEKSIPEPISVEEFRRRLDALPKGPPPSGRGGPLPF
jgi:very-short-patch-repair endonuclease